MRIETINDVGTTIVLELLKTTRKMVDDKSIYTARHRQAARELLELALLTRRIMTRASSPSDEHLIDWSKIRGD